MAQTMNVMLNAALAYGKRGWRVFPLYAVTRDGGCECTDGAECTKPGKHPAIMGWNKEASCDPAQIKAWWGGFPSRGIGIATGEDSGLTVLDVDGEEGVEELGKLAGSEGMPRTPCSSSRPGRFHYYFRYKEGIKSKSKVLGTSHLDTRGDSGYVVAPPSRHASGSVYAWVLAPEKAELAAWPEFLSGKKKAEGKRGRPERERFNRANPLDVEKLTAALEFVDPDDEEKWSAVGWILGRAYEQTDEGFAIYSAWAARSRKYDKKRTHGHYYEQSKRPGPSKTTKAIFEWAKEGGWTDAMPGEMEARDWHVFENPFREETMVMEFGVAAGQSNRIFSMGLRLVNVVLYGKEDGEGAEIQRDKMTHVVLEHDQNTLAVEFGNIAGFWKLTAEGFKRSSFPRSAILTFLACKQFSAIKPLIAFISHPTIRKDGTMIEQLGYDAASQLFLTDSVPGLKVESGLSRKEAAGAMRRLLEPFSEYPWASGADRAVFCAAVFTVGLRHLFDVAPLFGFSSPKHGSGKTQLAECISRLWYGTTLSKATWTPNPEEMEKRIASFLLAGDRMVCLDNVTEGMRLEDSTLNKVLTSRRNTFRILGRTERVELTNEATWFATGNQLSLSGDIARRALMCYVDAKVVDPGSRSFTIPNLPAHVMENRAELMSLALSIVSSWITAGRPAGPKAHREYGSFTDWYAMIRGLLLWVGEDDIAKSIDAVTEEDTEGMALEHFANALRRALPPDGTRLSLMQVLKLFSKGDELRPAFAGCMPSTQPEPNHRSLSDLLRRCEHKIFIGESGSKFTINKVRDVSNNTWSWGVDDV